MRLKLFKIIVGEYNYSLDHFRKRGSTIASVTFRTNCEYKLTLKCNYKKTMQYTNNESIDITYFKNYEDADISIISNCNGILEITYKKVEYKGTPVSETFDKFTKRCSRKYYSSLFTKKDDILYIDRMTITNLENHHYDTDQTNYCNEYLPKNKYMNVSEQTELDAHGDVIFGIEINAVEQTVCNIGNDNEIFFSFNVKQGKHNYDILLFMRYSWWNGSPLIWFDNDHVNVIKCKGVYLPYAFLDIFRENKIIIIKRWNFNHYCAIIRIFTR